MSEQSPEENATSSLGTHPGDFAPTHGYRAYGLAIRSEIPLPELEPDAAEHPDITILRRPVPAKPADATKWSNYEWTADEQYMSWTTAGRFLVQGTDTVLVDPAPGATEGLLALPLLGPVMAILLYRRGLLVLHGSALDVGGNGVVFLGDKGAGKSTTATAFAAAGHRLLTDDVLALDVPAKGEPRIFPGFPQVKLLPGAAEAIAVAGSTTLPEPMTSFPKELRRLNEGFSHEAVVPARIYVLERGEGPGVTELSLPMAVGALMRFSYVNRSGARGRGPVEAAAQLQQCAHLATHVRVARLHVPAGLDRLSEVMGFVETDIAAAAGGREG